VKQAGRKEFPPRYSDQLSYEERSLFKERFVCFALKREITVMLRRELSEALL
jgi:hypothetical protein